MSPRPDPPDLAAEVERLVAEAGTRRSVPRRCHVGTPGAERLTVPAPLSGGRLDPVLAIDLVARALDGLERRELACAWVTRFGSAEPDDADRSWHVAAAAGFARHGLDLPGFWLVHRTGFVDLGGER